MLPLIKMGVRTIVAILVLVVLVNYSAAQKSTYFNNIPGDWCKTRADPCCILRQDDCSVPIFGTLCYCDEFCNRDDNPDCCPDYAPVCLNIPRPTTTKRPEVLIRQCLHDGQLYHTGQEIKDNCRTCTCQPNGAMQCTTEVCLVDDSLLQQVQADQGRPNTWGWVATNYSKFWGWSMGEGMLLRTGTLDRNNVFKPVLLSYDPNIIQREFDARREWPGMISKVRDQGWCGSSWAFSTIGVANDRLAVESGGKEALPLSPQYMINCDGRAGKQGCRGGRTTRAWRFLHKIGVSDEECEPYISGVTGTEGQCIGTRRPSRLNRLNRLNCVSSNTLTLRDNTMYKMEPAYRIRSSGGESDIQYEIMTNGPVQAVMKVSPDFFTYRSGVYSSTGWSDNVNAGVHSVRIIGWGEEFVNYENVKYWLVANSWGEDWGENGLFRIRRGTNEAGIEDNVISVRAQLLPHYDPSLPGNFMNSQWFYNA